MAERLHVLSPSDESNAKARSESSVVPGFGPAAPPSEPIDLGALREKLEAKAAPGDSGKTGPGTGLWRSLDELAGTLQFQDWLHREFPRQASEWVEAPEDGVSRRRFLQLSGASLALAGLAGCTKQPEERVVPYVKMPEDLVPGRPMIFATTVAQAGYGIGVLAESHEGRPTKVEGNPEHPASLGSTDAKTQATVLDLYDPSRSQAVTHLGRLRSWSAFTNEVMPTLRALGGLGGEGLRFLSGTVTSPTTAAQMDAVLAFYPQAKWHRWEPAAPHSARRAAELAFAAPHAVRYDLTKAKVGLSLGSDFLTQGPASVRYSRDFSTGRHPRHGAHGSQGGHGAAMNRLYAVESMPTATATLADHRLALPPAEIEAFALALARALAAIPAVPAGAEGALSDKAKAWVAVVAEDLKANAGASVVIADEYGSVESQVLAHAMNAALGNLGTTVLATAPIEASPVDHLASISELAADLKAGKVEMLVVLGSNPVYDAPADLDFAAAIQKARLRVHLGLHDDETAELCQWHVPMLHAFEGWSDLRAFDGTASIVQPLIEPLYGQAGGKTVAELLAVFAEQPDAASYDLVRATWQARLTGDFEAEWRKALHQGVLPATEEPLVTPAVDAAAVAAAAATIAGRKGAGDDPGSLALLFRPDPSLYDGSLANNGWLQELPKPLTKLVWDNALMISPRTAQKLGLTVENMGELTLNGRKLEVGVWVQPGHADDCATLHLGYGRRRIGTPGGPAATGFQGELCIGHGFDAYQLRTTSALWEVPAVAFAKKPGRYIFASTQNHHLLESGADEFQVALEETEKRKPVKTGTWEQFQKNPDFLHAKAEGHGGAEGGEGGEDISLIPDIEYPYYAWGMSIDLSSCTGCNACVIACQAENNIPVVGKDQVLRGREMHWIRIDRYFEGSLDEPVVHNQPLPCMQCERAPCEVVCPVAATAHSEDGLNDMAYNRCVGTRYCANNCPYKVRRFNFLRYANKDVPVLKLVHNPDVTVRMRGVMEKCTFCVQRINVAKIDAGVAGRKVEPGDIVTACQQACPTQAIEFGDNKNSAWESTRRKAEPLNYALLEELNTRPRTTYLAKLNNPNPKLGSPSESARS